MGTWRACRTSPHERPRYCQSILMRSRPAICVATSIQVWQGHIRSSNGYMEQLNNSHILARVWKQTYLAKGGGGGGGGVSMDEKAVEGLQRGHTFSCAG